MKIVSISIILSCMLIFPLSAQFSLGVKGEMNVGSRVAALSFGGGLSSHYNIGKKLELSLDLLYNRRTVTIRSYNRGTSLIFGSVFEEIDLADFLRLEQKIEEIKGDITFISFPLRVNHVFLPDKKLRPFSGLGIFPLLTFTDAASFTGNISDISRSHFRVYASLVGGLIYEVSDKYRILLYSSIVNDFNFSFLWPPHISSVGLGVYRRL